MDVDFIPCMHPSLAAIIDYFLFFNKTDSTVLGYQTFPNTNICLAIYKQNHIDVQRDNTTNRYILQPGSGAYTSRLWGFHAMPLQVDIQGSVEQICINFKAGALRYFTAKPYTELLVTPNAFENIFGQNATYFLDHLFDIADKNQRALLLENFLLKKRIAEKLDKKTAWMLQHIYSSNGDIRVKELALQLQVNTSTLFRNFNFAIGQSPKDFIRTVRFRTTLNTILKETAAPINHIAYHHYYYDPAHFIKDFKQLGGTTPNELRKQLSGIKQNFVWVKNKGTK